MRSSKPKRTLRAVCAVFALVALSGCDGATVAPRVATKLDFVTAGSSIVAGQTITPYVRVVLLDANGAKVENANADVTIALAANPNGAALTGTTTVTAANGFATFSSLSIDKPGTGYSFTVSAQGLTSATSSTFGVEPGVPAMLELTSATPSGVVAGNAIAPIQVTLRDALGNLATNASISLDLRIIAASTGTVRYQKSGVPVNGVVTFSNAAVEVAGSHRLVVSATGFTPDTSDAFDIAPAAPAALTFVASPGPQSDAGRPINPVIQVGIVDAFGNAVTSATTAVTIGLASNPRATTLQGTVSVAAVNGVASFADLMIDKPANGYSLAASASGLSGATTNLFNVRLLFADVSAGGSPTASHTCAVTNEGAAYCWGANQAGQLGDGTNTSRLRPTLVSGGLRFSSISAGANHTCGVTTASEVYCWGDNSASQLGDGTSSQRTAPVKVSGATLFTAVSAGYTHTCAISSTGGAHCWGANPEGRLGDASNSDRNVPTAVSGSLAFTAISADSAHTCGLVGTSIYCWGDNEFGQLGDGTQSDRSVPTPATGSVSAVKITAGARHTCVVQSSLLYSCWGNNSNAQIGDGFSQDRTTPRTSPQPPWGTWMENILALSAGEDFNCGISDDPAGRDVLCWGNSGTSDVAGPSSLAFPPSNAIRLDVGRAHGCMVTTAGTMHCWGNNASGQIGDGTLFTRLNHVLVTP